MENQVISLFCFVTFLLLFRKKRDYYSITQGRPDFCFLCMNWDGCLRLHFPGLISSRARRVVSVFSMNYGSRPCPPQFFISVLDLCQNVCTEILLYISTHDSFSICIVCIQLETFSMESSVIFIKRLLLFM